MGLGASRGRAWPWRPGARNQVSTGVGKESPTAVGSAFQEEGRPGSPSRPRRDETMGLPRKSSPRGSTRRRVALWSALAVGSIVPSVGCQVEYAGMTLPSGRYMHDDVQYFPSSPDFPWANTQAATQRMRMRQMGIEPPPPPEAGIRAGAGALDPTQNPITGRSTNVNTQPVPPPMPGNVAPPQQGVPAPAPPGGAAAMPNE